MSSAEKVRKQPETLKVRRLRDGRWTARVTMPFGLPSKTFYAPASTPRVQAIAELESFAAELRAGNVLPQAGRMRYGATPEEQAAMFLLLKVRAGALTQAWFAARDLTKDLRQWAPESARPRTPRRYGRHKPDSAASPANVIDLTAWRTQRGR